MKPCTIIKALKYKGWYLCRVVGSHHHFKHETIAGLVTVPYHGAEDLKPATLHNIMKVGQISEKDLFPKKYKRKVSHKVSGVMNAVTDSY